MAKKVEITDPLTGIKYNSIHEMLRQYGKADLGGTFYIDRNKIQGYIMRSGKKRKNTLEQIKDNMAQTIDSIKAQRVLEEQMNPKKKRKRKQKESAESENRIVK